MAKNTAPNTTKNAAMGDEEDFSNWSEEQIGFAPYWTPEEGESVAFTVLSRDERSEDFHRYICRAEQNQVQCYRGKSANAEEVIVKRGEQFTMSIYDSLDEPFMFYLASGLSPRLRLTAKEKVPTGNAGREVWKWTLLVDPAVKPQLDALRAGHVAKQMTNGGKPARPALKDANG